MKKSINKIYVINTYRSLDPQISLSFCHARPNASLAAHKVKNDPRRQLPGQHQMGTEQVNTRDLVYAPGPQSELPDGLDTPGDLSTLII